jgi:hypothetical protein
VLCLAALYAQLDTFLDPPGLDPPPEVLSLLRCPPGNYLSSAARSRAERALRAHWRGLRRMGYQPLQADPGAAAHARGFLAYEDGAWPKPAACHAFWRRAAYPSHGQRRRGPRILPVAPRPPGTCEPNGTRCDKWRISRSFRFIWHHVWKAGTTSLSPYLSCNFDALPVARLLSRLGGPVPGYLHVGTAREPLGRFISGGDTAPISPFPPLCGRRAPCPTHSFLSAGLFRIRPSFRPLPRLPGGLFQELGRAGQQV